MKNIELLKENPFEYKRVNGITWLEFSTELMGYDKFRYKGKEIFKYQLFWLGAKPSEIIFNRNQYSCSKRIKPKY